MRVHVPLSSRTRVFAHLKLPFFGVVNDNTLSKLLLNSHAGGHILANVPRIMRNFAPRFRKTHPNKLLFSLTLCLYTLTSNKNTSSLCASIVMADRMLPHSAQVSWRPTKYPMLRDGILSQPTQYAMLQDGELQRPTGYLVRLRKYSHGRQNPSAICENIITADIVPPQFAQIPWWPTEYAMLRDGVL